MVYDRTAKPFSLEGHRVHGLVESVYDGDTIRVIFPLPQLKDSEDYLWSCRIIGIDTPELRGVSEKEKEWGLRARDRVRELILDRQVTLDLGGFDKYGRLLSSVSIEGARGTLQDIGQLLIDENLARPYDGTGTRMNWDDTP